MKDCIPQRDYRFIAKEQHLAPLSHCHHCKLLLGGQSAKVMLPACASSCSKWSVLCVGHPISVQQFDDSEDEEGSEDEARRKWQEQEAAVSCKTWMFKHVLLIRHVLLSIRSTPCGRKKKGTKRFIDYRRRSSMTVDDYRRPSSIVDDP